jgi:pimeloyl-ACP methyl ester carboxylesterase
MLAVRHVADHPHTPALVLLSAHTGGPNLVAMASKAGLFAGEQHETFLDRARGLLAQGRGHELMQMPGWWYVVTAQTFVDFCTQLPDTLAVAPQIHCPTLFIRGDKEPAAIYPAEAFRDHASGPCEVRIISDCDHFYTGQEDAVCGLIADWLRQSLAAKP